MACDYSASLSVKSRWRRFFSSALFVLGFVGFQNWLIFLVKGLGKKNGFHLVSNCFKQVCFGWSSFLIIWRLGKSVFWLLPKSKLCVKMLVSLAVSSF